MKALRIETWGGRPVLGEHSTPEPGPGEVLVEVEACGVGLTVLNCIAGHLGASPDNLPRTPGHELVGTVAAVGVGVPAERVGERVAAYFYLFCGRCPACLAGLEDRCANLAGFVGVDRDGGYGELTTLPARNTIPVGGLDPVSATVVPDAVATPVHVARRSGIAPGTRVAVVAAGGGVGIHMVQVARVYGGEVVGLDIDPDKLAYLGDELGVEVADSRDFESVALPAQWGGAADVVVDLLGNRASLDWALRTLGIGGRLVTLTTFPGVETPVSPREMVFRELSILGSRYATRHEVGLAAALVAAGRVRPVIGRQVGPDHVLSVHEDLRAGRLLGRGALIWRQPR